MNASASELPRGTVTFLFTDIERSTELVRQSGAEFGRLRSEHRRVLRDAFDHHGGHEIVGIASHVDDADAQGEVFNRDCPEITVATPAGERLVLLVNDLKSKGFGSQSSSNKKRRRQARRVAQIYRRLTSEGQTLPIYCTRPTERSHEVPRSHEPIEPGASRSAEPRQRLDWSAKRQLSEIVGSSAFAGEEPSQLYALPLPLPAPSQSTGVCALARLRTAHRRREPTAQGVTQRLANKLLLTFLAGFRRRRVSACPSEP